LLARTPSHPISGPFLEVSEAADADHDGRQGFTWLVTIGLAAIGIGLATIGLARYEGTPREEVHSTLARTHTLALNPRSFLEVSEAADADQDGRQGFTWLVTHVSPIVC
jgi:hypothetical protein